MSVKGDFLEGGEDGELEAGGLRCGLASAQMGAAWVGRTAPDPTSSKGRDRDPRTRQNWAKWHKLQVGKNLTSHPFDTPPWPLPKPPLPLLVYLL